MKPFLTEILACPIDKSYPLDLFIFQWEEPEPTILEFLQNPSIDRMHTAFEQPLLNIVEEEGGELLISDQIVLGKKPLEEYLGLVLDKIHELDVFCDKTNSPLVTALPRILGEIRDQINDSISSVKELNQSRKILTKLELALTFLNAYKQRIEVDQGLLRCSQCQRWFPIVEGIPQMLPDNLRNEKKELEFLAKWQDQLPGDIPAEGLPFHL